MFNGFLKFLLRDSDPRAQALRRRYVFKLIPMLNPDGVFCGHYRTDSRGVNLNRVYTAPSPANHPSIFAARKLLLYAHTGEEVSEDREEEEGGKNKVEGNAGAGQAKSEKVEEGYDEARSSPTKQPEPSTSSGAAATRWLRSSLPNPPQVEPHLKGNPAPPPSSLESAVSLPAPSSAWYEMTETSRFSEGDESIADFSVGGGGGGGGGAVCFGPGALLQPGSAGRRMGRTLSGSSGGADAGGVGGKKQGVSPVRTSFKGAFSTSSPRKRLDFDAAEAAQATTSGSSSSLEASSGQAPRTPLPPPPPPPVDSLEGENSNFEFARRLDRSLMTGERSEQQRQQQQQQQLSKSASASSSGPSSASNVFLYVDVHGHASKRGIFMYGNHFVDMETKVDSMLLPKLMSLNCANFDFPACNFTERNMYLKDRHTGAGREGSGRVSVFKATGLIYSYTLECNCNTGRVVNAIPMASRDAGRATPPPVFDHPPKYVVKD